MLPGAAGQDMNNFKLKMRSIFLLIQVMYLKNIDILQLSFLYEGYSESKLRLRQLL
jgi:hypothetical protein